MGKSHRQFRKAILFELQSCSNSIVGNDMSTRADHAHMTTPELSCKKEDKSQDIPIRFKPNIPYHLLVKDDFANSWNRLEISSSLKFRVWK
jgi:hypothetical protein